MFSLLGAVLGGLFLAQAGLLVTTVYLHRCLSHRALRLVPGMHVTARILIWILTGIRPRQWVAVHRMHHAFTDTNRDPHSPIVLGFPRVLFGNALLYRKVARDRAMVARYARDLPPDRWDRLFFDHALLGLGMGIGFLVLVFGWKLAIVVAGVHAAYYLLGGGAINAVGHRWGERPFDNLATNNQWLAWIVVGEGLHNNHHAASTSSRLSLAEGEFDPGWWCICLLLRLRWAQLRNLNVSAELARVRSVPTGMDVAQRIHADGTPTQSAKSVL